MRKTATKERPICLLQWEVKAILEGRKTQLRRPLRPQPADVSGQRLTVSADELWEAERSEQSWRCLYGTVGDRLWVREAWGCKEFREHDPSGAFSMSTGEVGVAYRAGGGSYACPDESWKSGSSMPRWASRITLRNMGVGVEQMGHISAKDARLCGLSWEAGQFMRDGLPSCAYAAREQWERDYGRRYPWDSNPWVWVIDFAKVEP